MTTALTLINYGADYSGSYGPRTLVDKAYVDNLVPATDALVFKGAFDASTALQFPAADAGWTYKVTGAGTVQGVTLYVGDSIYCTVDSTPIGTPANFVTVNYALDQATETTVGFSRIATQVETDAGVNDTAYITPLKLITHEANAGITHKFVSNSFGLTAAGSPWTINHNLNTVNVVVSVQDTATGVMYDLDVVVVDANNITLSTLTDVTVDITVIG